MEGQDIGYVHPIGSFGTCVIDMIIMRETVERKKICHKIINVCNLMWFLLLFDLRIVKSEKCGSRFEIYLFATIGETRE